MDELEIHRFPVVENEKLIGILTFGDIRAARSSEASSLSQYEMDYLLSNTEVSEVMTRNPKFIHPDSPAYDALRLMERNEITADTPIG